MVKPVGSRKRVLLLVDHPQNHRLLSAWLQRSYRVVGFPTRKAVVGHEAEVEGWDLAILDRPALAREGARIRAAKAAAGSEYLPTLLLTRRDQPAGAELFELVDEVITIPVEKAEFQARLENLLHARGLSLQAAAGANRRYRELFDSAPIGLYVAQADGRFADVNPALAAILGRPSGDHELSVFDLFQHADERARFSAALAAAGVVEQFEFEAAGDDERVAWLSVSARRVSGAGTRLEGSVQDVTDRKRAEADLRHQALHDALTGLPNRTLAVDRLQHALAHLSRSPDEAVGVLFIDVDHFKVVNDSLGHAAGDQLLVELSQRVLAAVRPDDTVARFGGDELVVVCVGLAVESDAERVAERIAEATRLPFVLDGRDITVTVSIGIATAVAAHEDPGALIRDADAALYKAKELGRARHAVFSEPLRDHAMQRLQIENELRAALARDELRVVYQPIVDAERGCVAGVEALVRWQHADRGLLVPGQFIGVAEETGLIVAVGEWVLQQACHQMVRWAQLPGGEDLTISVNLSARQVAQSDLPTVVSDVLRGSDLAPSRLALEITEDVIMTDASSSVVTVNALKALGVDVAIDDFGTGYSSLAYLSRFSVDALKVDRSFVNLLDERAEGAAIVSTIVQLARALGLRVVAEGVETAAQATQLRVLGADYMQGYHFARPLAAEGIERLLRAGSTLAPAG